MVPRAAPPPRAHAWEAGLAWLREFSRLEADSHAPQHRYCSCMRKTSKQPPHLRMATVNASGDVAQGQMTSGLSPLDWKTLRNASQEDMDPA